MAGQAGRLIALGIAAVLVAMPAVAASSGRDLLHKIDVKGARAVLEEDFNLDGGPGYAIVEAGSPDGIKVAVTLLTTVADAAFSEGLHSSLGKAMQRHPENVLPIVDTNASLAADEICLPFLSAETSRSHLRRQVALTRAALNRPLARHYPKQRAACMAQLAIAERNIR